MLHGSYVAVLQPSQLRREQHLVEEPEKWMKAHGGGRARASRVSAGRAAGKKGAATHPLLKNLLGGLLRLAKAKELHLRHGGNARRRELCGRPRGEHERVRAGSKEREGDEHYSLECVVGIFLVDS